MTTEVFTKKRRALQNLEAVAAYAENTFINRVVDNGNEQHGVITMGLPFLSLMDVLEGAEVKPDILKLGVVHPLPRTLVRDFVARHREVKVLEELDDILEKEVKAIAYDAGLTTSIMGKMDPEDWVGEYTADKVYAVMSGTWPDLLPPKKTKDGQGRPLPARPAQLCPGCGHRSAFYAIKKALAETDITVADIGCHTLGYLPPYEMGQLLMCMGASPGMGSGLVAV